VLRIFGPERKEVAGGWKTLHSNELHDVYSAPNIIRVLRSRRMRWAGHVECLQKMRNAYRVLVGKPEGKKPLGRSKCRFEGNIRMDL